jgi:hypothetical protein
VKQDMMSTRSRTIASFFTVAMAAMLVGAMVTTRSIARDARRRVQPTAAPRVRRARPRAVPFGWTRSATSPGRTRPVS